MSELLKMYKVLEDTELGQRVQGAVVKQAHYVEKSASGFSETARAFARLVLADPFTEWRDFKMEVAANGSVLETTTLSKDRSTVYTHEVQDDTITYVVSYCWDQVAQKYAAAPEGETGG